MTRNNLLLVITLVLLTVLLVGIKTVQSFAPAVGAKPMVLSEPIACSYCTAVGNGSLAFAKDHGTGLRTIVSRDGTQGTINSDVESMFTLGHSAFAIYPVDASGSKGLFGRLHDAGCFVVAYGAQPEPGTQTPFAVATDTRTAATTATEELIKLMGGRGRILNVLESLTDANTPIRRAAIEAVVANHPGVKIVQTIGDMSTPEDSREKIEGTLVALGFDVDGIICTGSTTSVGAANILTEYHRKPGVKRIHFVGLDDDPVVLAAIKNGSIDMTLAQNPFGQGYISCALLQLMIEGHKPASAYQFIDSGFVVVTRENVDSYGKDVEETTRKISSELLSRYFLPAQ
jgi:ribose transport system substrate-binding protein